MRIIEEIEAIVAREVALQGESLEWRIRQAIAQLPGVDSPDIQELRWCEYDLGLKSRADADEESAILSSLRSLDIAAAPEVAAVIPFADDECVFVRRYWACPGERLLDPRTFRGRCSAAQCARYRTDMERLFAHGKAHPWARGFGHMYISEHTHTILLNAWPVLQARDAYDEKLEFLEYVERQIRFLEEP